MRHFIRFFCLYFLCPLFVTARVMNETLFFLFWENQLFLFPFFFFWKKKNKKKQKKKYSFIFLYRFTGNIYPFFLYFKFLNDFFYFINFVRSFCAFIFFFFFCFAGTPPPVLTLGWGRFYLFWNWNKKNTKIIFSNSVTQSARDFKMCVLIKSPDQS